MLDVLRSPRLAALAVSLSLSTAACGDDGEDTPASDAGDTASDAGGSDGSPGGASFTVDWGPVDVGPGEEATKCVVKSLGNDGPIRVGQFHNVLGDVSHHFIVYRVNEGTEQPEPFDCAPFVDTFDPEAGAPLMVTQKYEETLTLPEGVAFSLQPQQLIRLELHYINASDEARTVTASSTFTTIADDRFEHEADFLFVGNPDIEIPAMSQHTLGPSFLPLPPDLAGSQFFGITGHTHQFGTAVEVAVSGAAADPGTMVYQPENFLWDEPETVMHSPPFSIPEGGGFRFSCSWNNTSDRPVSFGEGAGDEMCFFWAYYYPSRGAKVCIHTDQAGGESGLDLCCPGDVLCALLEEQL